MGIYPGVLGLKGHKYKKIFGYISPICPDAPMDVFSPKVISTAVVA